MFKSIIVLISLLATLTGCLGQSLTDQKKDFENHLVKALNLKFINRDTDYQYSRLRIFGDTLVGFWDRIIDNQQYKSYYIQSLKNPAYKIEFNNAELVLPSISPVDYYKSGCLYFGKFLGSTMQTLCSDGTLTEYFNKDQDTDQKQPSVESQVIIYKDQAILSLNSGIFIYNIPTQKLIWKYVFVGKGEAPCTVFGNKLIVSQQFVSTLDVICYELDDHQLIWTQKFIGDSNSFPRLEFGPQYELSHDYGNVIISGRNACYIIDISSGIVKNTLDWKAYLEDEQVPNFKVENNILYMSDFSNNSKGIISIDVKTKKTLWKYTGASFLGIYKDYLIGYSSEGYYLVINKSTGIVKDKIYRPHESHATFSFLDNYILINHNVIYQ